MPNRSSSDRARRPFVTLPRHRRRSLVIRLQGRMRCAHYTGSTLFDSDHLLINPEEPNRLHGWVDVVFSGLDRFTLWNAAFITTEMAKRDLASEQAHEQISAQLAAANETYESRWTAHLIPRKRAGEQPHDQSFLPHGVCARKTLRLPERANLFTSLRCFGKDAHAEPAHTA